MGLDGYCQNVTLLYIISVFKLLIKILQIVTPVIVIVLVSFSLYHFIVDPSKGKNVVVNRLRNGIIGVLVIFLVPTLMNNIIHNFSNGAYVSHCWDEADTEVNFKGSFIEDEEAINFSQDIISGSVDSSDLNPADSKEDQSSSSSSANVTGDTQKLIAIAKEQWLKVVHGGYSYGAGSNHVPFSPPIVDCSTYVSTVLYYFGYKDFEGMQHHTKEFMEINWNAKYGWTEIPLAAGEDATSKLKPGDILVRTNPGGYGHVNFIVSVENGVVKAYDCGSSSHWQHESPITVGNFLRSNRPGKIIRVT